MKRLRQNSFSYQVRDEIASVRPSVCCRPYILSALLHAVKSYRLYSGSALCFSSPSTARYAVKLFKYFDIDFAWTRKASEKSLNRADGEAYYILKFLDSPRFPSVDAALEALALMDEKKLENGEFGGCDLFFSKADGAYRGCRYIEEAANDADRRPLSKGLRSLKCCCRRSWLRGLFLCFGFISEPKKEYNLEWMLPDRELAHTVRNCLLLEGLKPVMVQRRSSWAVSLRRAEEAALALSVIGANSARLNYEEVRALKETRGEVSRRVNAESANLARTSIASVRQISYIKALMESEAWAGLNPELQEVGNMRLENPEASLRELCAMFAPPLARTTLSRRLKKLEDLGKSLS
ncbi:DNA-binding protein WhiA [bacterium]|nr:DNA-binding protein WhiA [bacterium]